MNATETKNLAKVKATFTGQNGSMGYETGKEYELEIKAQQNQIIIQPHAKHGSKVQPCIYNSIITFLKNWNEVKVKQPKKQEEKIEQIAGARIFTRPLNMPVEISQPKNERGDFKCTQTFPMPVNFPPGSCWEHEEVKEVESHSDNFARYECQICGHSWRSELPQ